MRTAIVYLILTSSLARAASYEQVAPVLKKYCVSCHNAEDRDGELSLATFADMLKGGKRGVVLMPGDSKNSRLIRVLTGLSRPKMPPRRSPAPPAEAIALLASWIDDGATGPKGAEPIQTTLSTPELPPAKGVNKAITSMDWAPNGKQIALARFKEIELRDAKTLKLVRKLSDHPGKINAIEYLSETLLLVASGVTGLYGEATIWNVDKGTVVRRFRGHRDTLYSATMRSQSDSIATPGYDKQIILWDVKTGKEIRTLHGHNGAVYDLAFSPDGTLLASAGADDTVKIWQVSTGKRLDTLGQPLKEQYAVTFTPDGRRVLAGGVDNRIRAWRIISKKRPRINPILYSRFAHEAAIAQIEISKDGQTLVTVGEDRTIKLWNAKSLTQRYLYERQPDVTPAIALSPDAKLLAVGRMNGSLKVYPVEKGKAIDNGTGKTTKPKIVTNANPMKTLKEAEPNDTIQQATPIQVPAEVHGTMMNAKGEDVDLYRFNAKAGERWVVEVNAARMKSPMDSKIAILDAKGKPVLRTLLRAVRDSYVTFRGINSTTRDCRVHNWEEMDLNQYIYLNGEVVKLHTAPRGPDSGFFFYPDDGSRRNYFGTTATSHALHEPCYVVEPHPPGSKLIPNGLPVFKIYYENDDDSMRQLGKDSRLIFTAPSDGEFLVRVTDVRGATGEKLKYKLIVRPARPNFSVRLHGANPTINPGSGKEFFVKANRIDGYSGPIRVDIKNLPKGFYVTTPLVIEANHDIAYGTINALPNAQTPKKSMVKVTASATINGERVTNAVNSLGTIKVVKKKQLQIELIGKGDYVVKKGNGPDSPEEWVIEPGQTIAATVKIKRNGMKARVQFEALKQNLPHGIIIDNIGLNGLLIVEGQSERTFFLTATKWVPETTRTFHLKTGAGGSQSSWPIILHVRKPEQSKK